MFCYLSTDDKKLKFRLVNSSDDMFEVYIVNIHIVQIFKHHQECQIKLASLLTKIIVIQYLNILLKMNIYLTVSAGLVVWR